MPQKKTFLSVLNIQYTKDLKYKNSCFFSLYRQKEYMFAQDNTLDDLIHTILAFAKNNEYICFVKYPIENHNNNPLINIIDYCKKKKINYSLITTDKSFNDKSSSLSSLNHCKDKNIIQEEYNHIIEVKLFKPYSISFRNLQNYIPCKQLAKTIYPYDSVYSLENNIKQLNIINKDIRNNIKNINLEEIRVKVIELYYELEYYYRKIRYEMGLNIYRKNISFNDIAFMGFITSSIIWNQIGDKDIKPFYSEENKKNEQIKVQS